MNIRESIKIIEANVETPTLESIVAQIIRLQEQGAELAAAQVRVHLQTLDHLVPGHKFSLNQGMGSTSVHITPPIEDQNEDGSDHHIYDIVSPSEMGYMEHDYFGDFVPQMVQVIKQIFEIAEYVDENFNSDLGVVE